MEIRPIKETDDKFAISRIYEESWKFAYRDIIPKSFLESIPVGNWVPHLAQAGRNSLVIVEGGALVGTSSYGPSRFSDFDDFGEIMSIYLLPQYMGKGYGRQLLHAAVGECTALGYHDLFLWVLEENFRARAFYEKAGFTRSGAYLDVHIGGKTLREVQYCYHVE